MKGTFWNTIDQTYHVDHMAVYFFHVTTNKLIYFGFWTGVIFVAFSFYTFFTSSIKRKTSIFRLHLFILPLTILFNIDQMIFWYKTFQIAWLKPNESASKSGVDYLVISNEILIHLLPLLAESTLLLQISSFFPPTLFSFWFRFGILAPFVVLLIARFILSFASATFVILAWNLAFFVPNSPFPIIPFSDWLEKARNTALVEYILGMLYCLSASSFLLFKAYKFVHSSKIADRPPIERKLRFLTETIFMCFLPPAALTIAGVAARMKKTSNMGKTLYEQEKVVSSLVNVSVLFALLATTWSSIRTYADEKIASQKLSGKEQNAMVDSIPLVESESGTCQRRQSDCQQHEEAQVLIYDEI